MASWGQDIFHLLREYLPYSYIVQNQPPVTTYTVVPTTLWTHVEPSIGLICSCQPVNGDFFQNFCFLAAGRERSTDIGATRYYPSAYVSHFAISTGSSLPSIDYHHLNMKAAVQE